MTREEYEEKIDNKIKTLRTEQSAEVDIKLDRLKQELMEEFKEETLTLDGWKVGDKYYYININGGLMVDYIAEMNGVDKYRITHNIVSHTEEEAKFKRERDAVLYELSKFAEPEDRVWDGSLNNHWYMYWNCSKDKIEFDFNCKNKHNDIYFASKEDAEKAIQAVGEERIKRFYLGVEE